MRCLGVGINRIFQIEFVLLNVQLLEAAEAKASFGLVSNWSGLNKVVDHLVEHETLSGTQLAELLHQNEGMFFPDPFVEGFGFNDDREIVFPGSEEVTPSAGGVVHQTKCGVTTTIMCQWR